MYTTTYLLGGWCATFHTSIASEFCDEVCDLYIHSCDYLKKTSIKINVVTDKGNTQNEIWHWINNEIGVAVQNWLWVQVNSWSNNSVSRLKRLHGVQWLLVQIPIIMVTDKSNSRNEIWHGANNKVEVAVQRWLWVWIELMVWWLSRLKYLSGVQWSWVGSNLMRGYFRNWGQHPEDTKKGTSSLKKVKKGTLNLTSLYVDSLFTIVLTK